VKNRGNKLGVLDACRRLLQELCHQNGEVFRTAQGNFSVSAKKEKNFFCFALDFSSLDACRRLLLQELCHKNGEVTPSRQKKETILLFCARLFVTLHPNCVNRKSVNRKFPDA
jgi:hypothetical protein